MGEGGPLRESQEEARPGCSGLNRGSLCPIKFSSGTWWLVRALSLVHNDALRPGDRIPCPTHSGTHQPQLSPYLEELATIQ